MDQIQKYIEIWNDISVNKSGKDIFLIDSVIDSMKLLII